MMINSVPCVNETKVNGRPVLWPPTQTFLGPRHAFLETKAFSVNAFHNLVINAQPRPQGAFPWLWRWAPHLQSQGKRPGDEVVHFSCYSIRNKHSLGSRDPKRIGCAQ